jgi:hypothetical protein
MIFLTKLDGYRKMCDTNKNVTEMGVIIKGVYYGYVDSKSKTNSIKQTIHHKIWFERNIFIQLKILTNAPPNLLERLKCEFENENNERSWGTSPNSQHFEGKRGMLEFWDGD